MHNGLRLIVITSLAVASMVCISSAYRQAASQRGVQDLSSASASASTAQFGSYYALVIGNNNYRYLPKLRTAINDASAVAQLLHERYGFSTKVLRDATRNDVLTALNEYRRTLSEKSSLLIYYAGHGHHDPDTDKAYWLPVDAQSDNNDNWISADDITSDVKAIPSQHVLIISDSCYSGVLTRDADAAITPRERGAYLDKMLRSKSRTLMSSGGDEPVADGGAAGHSVFAGAVLDSLRQMEDEQFTASNLFQRFIQPGVAGRSDQVPQYSLIRNSDAGFGDFVFSRKPDVAPPRPPSPTPTLSPQPPPAPNPSTVSFSIYFTDAFARPGAIYRLQNGNVTELFRRAMNTLYSVAVSTDGAVFFCDANEYNVYKIQGAGEKVVYRHTTYVRALAVDSRGALYFSEATGGGGDGKIYRLDGSTAVAFYTVRLADVDGSWAGDFAFDQQGTLWLSSGNQRPANLYKVAKGVPEVVFTSADAMNGLSFASDGSLIYTGMQAIYRLSFPALKPDLLYQSTSTHAFLAGVTAVPR
jgi:hypothetical protein